MTARMGVPGGHGADWADSHTIKQFSTPQGARDAMKEVLAYKPDMVKGFHDGCAMARAPTTTPWTW